MIRNLVVDFETTSACDLKKCGSSRYAQDPTTEILCLNYRFQGEWDKPWRWQPIHGICRRLLNWLLDRNVMFVAHNAGFEKDIWRWIMVPLFGWPDIPNSRWHDTMATCAMRGIPQELDKAVRVLRLPHIKDTAGSAFTKALSKTNKKTGMYDRSPETLERVMAYCDDDVIAEAGLLDRLGWLPPGERRVWLLDQRINERGVRLDLPFVHAAQTIVDRASVPLIKEFAGLTGGLKLTQVQKVRDWCLAEGANIPNLKKDTLDELLGSTEDTDDDGTYPDPGGFDIDLPPSVHRALSIRSLIGSTSVKKLARMAACVGTDGRVRRTLQYHSAGSGRWGGRLFQPHNFPRGTLKLGKSAPDPDLTVAAIMTGDPEYVAMLLGPPVEVVVSALRHSIIADHQRRLTVGDFKTVELRVVLGYAEQWDKIEMIKAGGEPYCDMAGLIYERPITKADKVERDIGKHSVLGLGYGMGDIKFRFMYAREQTPEFCKRTVGIYRKEWAPGVPKVWGDFEHAACRAVWDKVPQEARGVQFALDDGALAVRLPSGRKIWFHNPVPVKRAMPWDETDVRPAWTYDTMKMGRWITVDAFGGLLTGVITQATARDLLTDAAFKAEENGLPVCLTVHDELICEPEIANADALALEQIMCEGTGWSRAMNIPIGADCWTGDRYKK